MPLKLSKITGVRNIFYTDVFKRGLNVQFGKEKLINYTQQHDLFHC